MIVKQLFCEITAGKVSFWYFSTTTCSVWCIERMDNPHLYHLLFVYSFPGSFTTPWGIPSPLECTLQQNAISSLLYSSISGHVSFLNLTLRTCAYERKLWINHLSSIALSCDIYLLSSDFLKILIYFLRSV